jgi:hypothetical protein
MSFPRKQLGSRCNANWCLFIFREDTARASVLLAVADLWSTVVKKKREMEKGEG